MQILFATLPIIAIAAGPARAEPPADTRSISEQGYAGLTLRDIPGGHTVVSWIFPGPLDGEGLAAPKHDLARPDLVVAVNGRAMTADEWHEFVLGSNPGHRIVLQVRTSRARGGGIPDTLDHEEALREIEFTLASRDEWIGTMKRPRQSKREIELPGPPLLDPFDDGNVLGAAIVTHELEEPLRTLLGVFNEWLAKDDDFHMLGLVRAGFLNPFRVPELHEAVDSAAVSGSDPVRGCLQLVTDTLDLAPEAEGLSSEEYRAQQFGPETPLMAQLAEAVTAAAQHSALAFDRRFNQQLVDDGLDLLRVPKGSFYIQGPSAKRHIDVIRASMHAKLEHLVSAARSLAVDDTPTIGDATLEADLPTAIAAAVEGPIHSARQVTLPSGESRWIVIGSRAPNRYDMAMLAAVVDPGGDDEYYATARRLGNRLVIDLAGDDHYTGTPEQGPASAILGVSLIDDRAGNDKYEGELLSAGAAMFGISILLDRAGADVYVGREWSLGAACSGAGIIVDLGNDADTYLGDFLCQGVGGPRGFGAIIDAGGNDLYRANGPTTSAYGTAGVYQSFSQGVGFGYRNYAAGGVGLIRDLAGNDRYEAGEFAQGGAYYYGLGILHDLRGRDLYYGNRYGQGFGVHQAVGVLVDDEGDDTYWSMTAASQGSAWDIGIGVLLDRSGNDSYQCDALGQGGAAMQGIAMLIDLDGIDRYAARGGAVQGESSGNSYHHHETGAFSFSVLLDRGGGEDWYSSGRRNASVLSPGSFRENQLQHSTLHGVFVDE